MPIGYGQVTQQQMDADVHRMANALLRVPILTRSQLAHYAALSPVRVKRLLERYDTHFRQYPYNGAIHRASTYGVGTHGTQHLVSLTSDGLAHYGRVNPPRQTPSASVGRVLATGVVLLAIREAGLIGHDWDMRVPHERHVSIHAWIQHVDDEKPSIGLFLLPHKGDVWTGKRSILRGYVDRTIQNISVHHLLFVCPAKHYERALRQLVMMEGGTGDVHVLPVESFLRNPFFFLDAIRTSDRRFDDHLLLHPPKRRLSVPMGHSGFRALIEDKAGVYQLIDGWNDGAIRSVQGWLQVCEENMCLIPDDPGKAASGWVYVEDDVMRAALGALLHAQGSLARVK